MTTERRKPARIVLSQKALCPECLFEWFYAFFTGKCERCGATGKQNGKRIFKTRRFSCRYIT